MPPKRRHTPPPKNEQCSCCRVWFTSVARHQARPENPKCYRYQSPRQHRETPPAENLTEISDSRPLEEDDFNSDWLDIEEGWSFKRPPSPDVYTIPADSNTFSREAPRPRLTKVHPTAGATYGQVPNSRIQQFYAEVDRSNPYFPFADATEWQMAAFLAKSGLSRRKIDEFLHTKYVVSAPFTFKTSNTLYSRVEELPSPPRWTSHEIRMDGYPTHRPIILYSRDVLQCVKELFGNPSFKGHMDYAPVTLWADVDGKERLYGETMSSGTYWNTMQDKFPPGTTIIPLIVGSDATMLTRHQGDQKCWPVYVTLATIHDDIRNKPSFRCWRIVGYLPLPKFKVLDPDVRGLLERRVYHECMDIIFRTIREAGHVGQMMVDPDGLIRQCIVLYAAHLADNPEQCLSACVPKFRSPITMATYTTLSSPNRSAPRTRIHTLNAIKAILASRRRGTTLHAFVGQCRSLDLNGVTRPFWEHLPHADPSIFLVCDILHQLHKFFLDHPFKWIQEIVGVDELDRRISSVQHIVGIKQFSAGVSRISQWTGREHRELQRIILPVVAGASGLTSRSTLLLRNILDIIYLAQYPTHTKVTTQRIRTAIHDFHTHKSEILRLKTVAQSEGIGRANSKESGYPKTFNIPKLEMLHNLVPCIERFGSLLQFTADITEHLHIANAKTPFAGGNKKNEPTAQMCRYLDRGEKVENFGDYLGWREIFVGDQQDMVVDTSTEIIQGESPVRVGKIPHESNILVDDAAVRYGIWDLRGALADYYTYDLNPKNTKPRNTRRSNHNADLPFEHINIWHCVRIEAPPTADCELPAAATLTALPPSEEQPCGLFNCVLLQRTDEETTLYLKNQRIAQVRIILQAVRPGNHPSLPTPFIAYTEFFKSSRAPDPITKMLIARREDRRGGRRGEIVELASFLRIIQLIPRWKGSIPESVNMHNALEIASEFFLNPFFTKDVYRSISGHLCD